MLNFHLKLPRRYFQMNVDFAVQSGNIYCLYGPSAAGKSSILSVLAGFETGYDEVRLELDGSVLLESGPNTEKNCFMPAWRRQIGYLAQSVPLFPHLSVQENIRFGMDEMQGRNSALKGTEAEAWYEEIVRLLELKPYLTMSPQQLSGGLIQRAALARALVPRPHLLLLDEPFSALDWQSRSHMQEVVLELQQRMDMTIVLVTHQLEEAQRMADIIGLIDEGQILQEASPSALMTAPRNWKVARLLGYQQFWKDGGKYYALHPDRGVVLSRDADSKSAGAGSAGLTVEIDGTVQVVLLKDGRRLAQLAVNRQLSADKSEDQCEERGNGRHRGRNTGRPDSFRDSLYVNVGLSPLQSVYPGEKVTAVFINPPELRERSMEDEI